MKTIYSTIVGSRLYGIDNEFSDTDIKGFGFPEPSALIGLDKYEQLSEKTEDTESCIYTVQKFLHLCHKGNPTVLEVAFSKPKFHLVSTPVGLEICKFVQDNLLTKDLFKPYSAYFREQVRKLDRPNREGKRQVLIDKYGFDCYLDCETEFLTDTGWKKYDDITVEKLATLDANHNLEFQSYSNRIKKLYTGDIYTLQGYLSKCQVTLNHNLYLSNCHRNPKLNYSTKYDKQTANWELISIKDYLDGKRSSYHIIRHPNKNDKEFSITDDYLKIAGLFISEGSIEFRDNKVKNGRITQTINGKLEVFKELDSLGLSRYDYEKETIWLTKKGLAERLYKDFGHGSRNKRLPYWVYKLSSRQALLFWHFLYLGDGTQTPNGQVYCSCNEKLASDIHAMMICAGFCCTMNGPFDSISSFTNTKISMYQVYMNKDSAQYIAISKRNLSESKVKNKNVVCFEVPNGILITKNDGKVSIQGNCKFAAHAYRLGVQCCEIMEYGNLWPTLGHIDQQMCKDIRSGVYCKEEVKHYLSIIDKNMYECYQKSALPDKPDFQKLNKFLTEIHLKYLKGEYDGQIC